MTWTTPESTSARRTAAPSAVGYDPKGTWFYYPSLEALSVQALRAAVIDLWVEAGGYEDDIIVEDRRQALIAGKPQYGFAYVLLRHDAPGADRLTTLSGKPTYVAAQVRWDRRRPQPLHLSVNVKYAEMGLWAPEA